MTGNLAGITRGDLSQGLPTPICIYFQRDSRTVACRQELSLARRVSSDHGKECDMDKDTKAQQAIEETGKKPFDGQDQPAAGPHDKEHLQDESKTPGAGALPDEGDESVSPGSG
jgi:hypothetical protein